MLEEWGAALLGAGEPAGQGSSRREQGLSSPLGLGLRSQQKLSELEQSRASLLRACAAIPGRGWGWGGGVGWEEVILGRGEVGVPPTPEAGSADL